MAILNSGPIKGSIDCFDLLKSTCVTAVVGILPDRQGGLTQLDLTNIILNTIQHGLGLI